MDRTQNLRIDCPKCHGKGYNESGQEQEMCVKCEGSGMLEKTVSYKFETGGRWSKEELADEFGVSTAEVGGEDQENGNEE